MKILDYFLSLQAFDCFIEHLAVQVVAHSLHVTALRLSQQVSGSPDFQISHGDLKTASQLREFPDGSQTFLCHFL